MYCCQHTVSVTENVPDLDLGWIFSTTPLYNYRRILGYRELVISCSSKTLVSRDRIRIDFRYFRTFFLLKLFICAVFV